MQALVDRHRRRELQLVYRIQKRYRLSQQAVTLNDDPITLYQVADADRVVEAAIAAESHLLNYDNRNAVDPFWAQHWTSSFAFATQWRSVFAKAGYQKMAVPRVTELGCGGGMLSVALYRAQVQLIATDASSEALLLAKLNGHANRVDLRTRQLDWRSPNNVEEKFDLIIGSDVAYDRKMFPSLEATILAVGREDAKAIFAEPNRSLGDEFIDHMLNRGWRVETYQPRFVSNTNDAHLLRGDRVSSQSQQIANVRYIIINRT
jgi:predicted nicotinamide N-methyase